MTTKNVELIRAREVKKCLSTKKLKVEDFASLHDDIMDLATPLVEDSMAAPIVMKYISAVERINEIRTNIKRASTVTSDASKTLKAVKNELSVFINIVKKARNSQSVAIKNIARAIYDEYVVALDGNRLNVINAKDIIKVFVTKLAKLDKAAIKAAGYEDYVTFITTKFNDYADEHSKAILSQEEKAKYTKQLVNQRDIVEGAYQMLLMMLNTLEYSTGSGDYTTTLNAIMLRVTDVRATQKAAATRRENQNADEVADKNNPQGGGDAAKPEQEEGKPNAAGDEKPATGEVKPADAEKPAGGDSAATGVLPTGVDVGKQ